MATSKSDTAIGLAKAASVCLSAGVGSIKGSVSITDDCSLPVAMLLAKPPLLSVVGTAVFTDDVFWFSSSSAVPAILSAKVLPI